MIRIVPLVLGCLATLTVWAGVAHGQVLGGLRASAGQETSSICGISVRAPSALPPDGSGPVIYLIAPCFPGNLARIPASAYLRHIQLRPSRPSQTQWVPFDQTAEQTILADFQRLWANHRLADLSVDIRDYRFANGVIGKLVMYNITELATVSGLAELPAKTRRAGRTDGQPRR